MYNEDAISFQEVLVKWNMRVEDECIAGFKLADSSSQAQLAQMYAAQADWTRKEKERLANGCDESLAMGQVMGGYSNNINQSRNEALLLRREAQEARAERDLWSLLHILTRSDLLNDVNADQCESSLQHAMRDVINERSSISEVVNIAISSDERIKKGRFLLEWLETAAEDKVLVTPESQGGAWGATLSTLIKSKGQQSGNYLKVKVESLSVCMCM